MSLQDEGKSLWDNPIQGTPSHPGIPAGRWYRLLENVRTRFQALHLSFSARPCCTKRMGH